MTIDEEQKKLAEEILFSIKKAPSFVKKLYFGIFDAKSVFPHPEVSQEEKNQTQELLSKLTLFLEKEVDPISIDRNAEIPDSVIKGLGNLGILGLTIPKEFGGLGMSQYAYCKAVECIAKKCASTALFVNAHQSVGLKAFLLFGTKEQKEKWLPLLAKGIHTAAFSLTEPNAGSDVSSIETKAIYDPKKKIYHITGQKQWTTNGAFAQVLTVMAKTEVETKTGKQEKITAFIVTPDMPGFKVLDPSLEKVGMRGTKTSNLIFNEMEVPEENILGPLGSGLRVCLTVLDYGRTTFGATCTGAAKVALKKAITHAKNRHQFKCPLASFPLVKKKIALIAALTYAMESTTYLTAGLIDSGIEDVMLEAAILKVFCSDSLWEILYETMQIYGGRSFFTDEPLERMMRDARLNMIGEGANEVLRVFIATVGLRDLGMDLKNVLEAFSHPLKNFSTLSSFAKKGFERWSLVNVPILSSQLFKEAKLLEKMIKKFGIACIKILGKYKEKVIDKQLDLDRIATAVMMLYTVTSVLSRLDRDLQRGHSQDLMTGKFYCKYGYDRFETALSTLFSKNDIEIEGLSDTLVNIF